MDVPTTQTPGTEIKLLMKKPTKTNARESAMDAVDALNDAARASASDCVWLARQGDVLIERIDAPDAKFTPAAAPVILAHGESTGHMHAIADFQQIQIAGDMNPGVGQAMLLKIKAPVKVLHQEHAPIDLPKGTYRVMRQREYSPEAIRNVAD